MLEITFRHLHSDPDLTPEGTLHSVIGQTSNFFADFEIREAGISAYTDDAFPVVEFAYHVNMWLHGIRRMKQEFTFDSMFFENPEEIRIYPAGVTWKICVDSGRKPLGEYTEGELVREIQRFIDELSRQFTESFGVELILSP